MKKTLLLLALLAFIATATAQETLKVAVWETKCEDGSITPFQSVMVRGGMEASVANVPGFSGYDRAAFDAIVKEHNFQRSGAVNDNDIRRLGEMAGVDYIIVPEAMASNNDFYIIVKMLNVESGQYGAAYEELCTTSSADIKKACARLAARLFGIAYGTDRTTWKNLLAKVTTNVTSEIKGGGKHIGVTDKPGLAFQLLADGTIYFGGYGFSDNTETITLMICGDGYEVPNCPGGWVYSGNYLNGKKNGDGVVYDRLGKLIYSGEFKDDMPTGKFPDNYPDKAAYTFEIVELNDNQLYVGELTDGVSDGMGIYFWPDGDAWCGVWENGNQNGIGMMMNYDGTYTIGFWENGQFAMTFEEAADQLKKEEEERKLQEKANVPWSTRLFDIMTANAKPTDDGWIWGDNLNGYCIEIDKINDYTALYCGQIKDGQRHGKGMCVTIFGGDIANNLKDSWAYTGEWKKGKKHGKETRVYGQSGYLIYFGQFGNDSYFSQYPTPSLLNNPSNHRFGGMNGDNVGDKYVGEILFYKNHLYRHGWGLLIREDGSAVYGNWYYDRLSNLQDAVYFSNNGEYNVVKGK